VKKITRSDIMPTDEYIKGREEYRAQMMKMKDTRRVSVGPYLTFLFETKETMVYQVQEMLRAEGIRDEGAIQHEIDTYNELVPGSHELRATLLIEIDDPVVRKVKLEELVGLENHIALVIDRDYVVSAVFDEKQMDPDKLSSVQYIYFPLGEKATQAFLSTSHVEIVISHPGCSYRQSLSERELSSLKDDLSRTN